MKIPTAILLVILLLAASKTALAAQEEIPLPEGIELALPSVPEVKAEWVLPPETEAGTNNEPLRFDVDRKGQLWLGYKNKTLFNPAFKAEIEVDQPYSDFGWMDGGDFLLCTDSALGYLEKNEAKNESGDTPVLSFKPVINLPYRNFRIFPGVGENLYLVGKNPQGSHEIYLLQSGQRKEGVMSKLFAVEAEITAVAGDGDRTYVAIGNKLLKLKGETAEPLFAYPNEPILGLAFSPEAGLFYATDHAVGLVVGPGELFGFLKVESDGFSSSENAQKNGIRLRGNTLYVYLERTKAALKIEGADQFNRMRSSR